VSKELRITLTYTVPTTDTATCKAAAEEFARAQGATELDYKVVLTSSGLKAKGFKGNLLKALVAAGLDTVEGLTGRTEEELRTIYGFKYPSIRDIKRTLHEAQKTLKGERLEDFKDSVEALRVATDTYVDLRRDGIRTIQQIYDLELPDAEPRPWWRNVAYAIGHLPVDMGQFEEYDFGNYRGSLEGEGAQSATRIRPLRPTNLDRPLEDFFKQEEDLQKAGITPRRLTEMTVEQLAKQLKKANPQRYSPGLDHARSVARNIRERFQEHGHDMLEG